MLYDMHCHLDFADNAQAVAQKSAGSITAMSATVVPSSFVQAREKFARFEDVHVALGIHPWWVSEERVSEIDLMRFDSLARQTPWIGEIGLDFSKRRKATKARQLEVFARILQTISAAGNRKTIFLHAVKSYNEIFQLMDRCSIFDNNTCVFHWFAGSRDDFKRALARECLFSVGPRMMNTETGAFFAAHIPDERLLIETDSPPHEGTPWSYDAWHQEITDSVNRLSEVRGCSPSDIEEIISSNSRRLLRASS